MEFSLRLLPGLPPYGPRATTFPTEWECFACEGTVVEFQTETGKWVANFQPGLSGIELASPHPNGRDAIVIATGDLWVVNPADRSAEQLLPAIDLALEVKDPDGWIFSRQGIALARFGANGLTWHTRQISWDGFDKLRIAGDEIMGLAWSPPDDMWREFRVDLRTGASSGGTVPQEFDQCWEQLANDP